MKGALLFAISMLALVACSATHVSPTKANVKISVANFAFTPQEVTIHPGDAVTWSNDDGSPHAVTFQDGANGAKSLLPGETFTRVFTQRGNHDYFCSFHPFMTGRIIVREP